MKNYNIISNRRILFFFIWFVLIQYSKMDAQWIMEKSPTNENLNGISLFNNENGWIVGDNGIILNKMGDDWVISNKLTNENLFSIHMVNSKIGWAVGAKGTILKYDGKSWQNSPSPTNKDLLSGHFSDAENGLAVGKNGVILKYRNGFWSVYDFGIKANLNTTYFNSENIWFGGGLECVNTPIIKTSSENPVVQNFNTYSFATINSIFILNDHHGWAVGSPSILLKFNGVEWEKIDVSSKFASLKSVFFSDENNGISVGLDGSILLFSEGKWIKENSNSTQNLKCASIIDNAYYAIGEDGTILKKVLPKSNNTQNLSDLALNSIKLYPNPCSDLMNIILQIESINPIGQILILNSLGQIILKDEINLDNIGLTYPLITNNLINGLYLLEVRIDNRILKSKFIVNH